jgi:hypothetical protein
VASPSSSLATFATVGQLSEVSRIIPVGVTLGDPMRIAGVATVAVGIDLKLLISRKLSGDQ